MAHHLSKTTRKQILQALKEDTGRGDVTSRILIPESAKGKAIIISKEAGIFCGELVIREILKNVDLGLHARYGCADGKRFPKKKTILELQGSIRSILRAERTLLNFIGHLSGIATKTRRFVDRVKGYPVFILDTRKTMPLWRELEKYAVRVGGGRNHRMGLHEAILIKENHRPFADWSRLKQYAGRFEMEVRNFKELDHALSLHPRIILFDNFKPAVLAKAVRKVRRIQPHIILEASGGIHLDNVVHYAALGVDWISVGALTHSVATVDFD